jgi:hypothetical protein
LIGGGCSARYKIKGVWVWRDDFDRPGEHGKGVPARLDAGFALAGGLVVSGGWNGMWARAGDTVAVVGAGAMPR